MLSGWIECFTCKGRIMAKHYEYLKCELNDAEVSSLARELATANKTRARIEQRKKEIDSDLKSQIEAENSKIGRLSDLVQTGHEMRDVECRIELDTPSEGMKRYVRLDTGETVKEVKMSDIDRQTSLDLQDAANREAELMTAAEAGPIVTPPPEIKRIDGPAVEVLPAGEPAVASVVAMGGSHQRGTRQNRGRRNPEAEAFGDGQRRSRGRGP